MEASQQECSSRCNTEAALRRATEQREACMFVHCHLQRQQALPCGNSLQADVATTVLQPSGHRLPARRKGTVIPVAAARRVRAM